MSRQAAALHPVSYSVWYEYVAGENPGLRTAVDTQLAQHGQLDEASIQQQIVARAAAKKARNFAEADRIRDDLLAQGIVLKDSAAGTTWEAAQ